MAKSCQFDLFSKSDKVYWFLEFNCEVDFNGGPRTFSLCLNSKGLREKSEGGKGQNTVVRKDPMS